MIAISASRLLAHTSRTRRVSPSGVMEVRPSTRGGGAAGEAEPREAISPCKKKGCLRKRVARAGLRVCSGVFTAAAAAAPGVRLDLRRRQWLVSGGGRAPAYKRGGERAEREKEGGVLSRPTGAPYARGPWMGRAGARWGGAGRAGGRRVCVCVRGQARVGRACSCACGSAAVEQQNASERK